MRVQKKSRIREPLRRIFFVFLLIVLILLVVVWAKKDTRIDQKSIGGVPFSCEERMKNMIPDKLFLNEHKTLVEYQTEPGNKEFRGWVVLNKWNDGSRISNQRWEYGKEKGQNINYLYPVFGGRYGLYYQKKVISEEGIVMGDNFFTVDLILKPIPNTEVTVKTLSKPLTYSEYEVIDIEFFDCGYVG